MNTSSKYYNANQELLICGLKWEPCGTFGLNELSMLTKQAGNIWSLQLKKNMSAKNTNKRSANGRYASRHKLVTLATKGAEAFFVTGFNNYKKMLEKFHTHDTFASHQEAMMKCHSVQTPSVVVQLSSQAGQAQDVRCRGLLMQLQAVKYLLPTGDCIARAL